MMMNGYERNLPTFLFVRLFVVVVVVFLNKFSAATMHENLNAVVGSVDADCLTVVLLLMGR